MVLDALYCKISPTNHRQLRRHYESAIEKHIFWLGNLNEWFVSCSKIYRQIIISAIFMHFNLQCEEMQLNSFVRWCRQFPNAVAIRRIVTLLKIKVNLSTFFIDSKCDKKLIFLLPGDPGDAKTPWLAIVISPPHTTKFKNDLVKCTQISGSVQLTSLLENKFTGINAVPCQFKTIMWRTVIRSKPEVQHVLGRN